MLEFEQLVFELSADFVSMSASAIDDGIERWLGRIVRMLGLERSTLVQLKDDAALLVRTHSYTAPGFQPLSQSIWSESDVPWLAAQMRERRTVVVSTIRDLPPEAEHERQLMQSEGLKSSTIIPLAVAGELIGFISFTSMGVEREWRPAVVRRLHLVANIFAGALRRKRVDSLLDRMRRFEALLSRISAAFVQLPTSDIDGALTNALQQVVEFLGIDRATILSISSDRSVLFRTHWHAKPGIGLMPMTLSTDYSWTFGRLFEGEPVVVSRVSDLPAEAKAEREYFELAGVRSTVAIPLFLGDVMLGAAIFSAIQTEEHWPVALVQRLQLLGGVFASALARQAMEDAQRELLGFEQLIANISARLAAIGADRVDEAITLALEDVLAFFGADQCVLLEAHTDNGSACIRYLTHDAGIAALPTDFDYATRCPLAYERLFIRGEALVRSRMGDCPAEDAIDREMVEGLGVRSMVALPVVAQGALRFAFGLGSSRENVSWPDEYVPRLRVLGDTLVNALIRARVDEALRTSEERFRSVVESAPNGVMVVDPDGRIVLANPQMEWIFGYDRGELLGTHVETLLPLRDRERHHAYRREFMSDPELRVMGGGRDVYGLRRDGTEVPIEIGLNPIGTSEGRFVLATVVDATERKQAELALRASARSLSEAQRVANLGSWEWDAADDRLAASEEAQRIVGIERGEFPGFLELAHPDDRPGLLETMERLLRNGEDMFDLEFRVLRPDGTERTVRVCGHTYFGPDGVPLRTVGTIQDVTASRKAEHEMRRLRAQLWHSDRLVRTGTLTASLAHELNQPLAAILSNAQAGIRILARDNPDLGEIREILGDIVRDDKRAAAVISGLRAMVRQKETERETVDVAAVLNEMLNILHSELVGAAIELERDLRPGCLTIADRVQLQQVVLNLVMNAIEAMRESNTDKRRICIASRDVSGAVQVRLTDTGPGISPERLESVFDPFHTTKSQGMGLGLAVCKSIVESHSGRIWVEAGDGGSGSTFIFELPATAGTQSGDGASGPGAAG